MLNRDNALDKKTLPLVILLVIVVVFYYPILEFLGLYQPSENPPQQETTITSDTVNTDTQVETAKVLVVDSLKEAIKPPALTVEPKISDSIPIDTITITTNKYEILLTNLGGGPKSLLLREYTYRNGEPVQMLPDAREATPDAQFAGRTFSSSRVVYTSSLPASHYDVKNDTLHLEYTYQATDDAYIKKIYTFYPDTYHYDLVIDVKRPDLFGFERQYTLLWNTPLAPTEPQVDRDYEMMEAVAMQSGSRERLDDFNNGILNQSLDGYTEWVGVRSMYFTAVLIPVNRVGDQAVAFGEKRNVATPDGRIEERKIMAGVVMPFAKVEEVADTFKVFIGPMDYMLMASYDVGLEDMLDIGTMTFFGAILKPFAIAIMWLLPRMYEVVPNYGLVIILFALLVKIITLPLSLKQFKSMQGMKDLAPKMEELKQKYKKDPAALQRETMKLYKSHGVNPMSGCLVMLPQMPLLFAMFRVFRVTILLRAAPFFGFIGDLSRGASSFTDPYIILVVLMVLTQFISSKLTMSGQQQQKALMYLFPLMMGFFLYKLPAGLILYWTAFSFLSLMDWFIFKRNKVKNAEVQTT